MGNLSVPLDRRNADFQRIRTAIRSGACEVVEPALGLIHRTLDRDGQPSGYRTRFGFVPDYRPSHLLTLIRKQIVEGVCQAVDAPKDSAPTPRFEMLVASIVLPGPWPGLEAECSGELAYAPKSENRRQHYRFTLRNLPEEPIDRIETQLRAHDVTIGHQFKHTPHQFGLLEIEIPTKLLRRIYLTERSCLPKGIEEFVSSLAAQHHCESRRPKGEGPDIQWLIQYAHLYTSHFVVEFSNLVIDAFRLEYGRVPVSSLLEGYRRESTAFFGRDATGRDHLLGFAALALQQHTPVPAKWFADSLSRYDADARSPTFLLRTALGRVAELVALGFHAEALALLNAFLEVLVSNTLTFIAAPAQHLVDHAKHRMGHSESLAVLTALAETDLMPAWFRDSFTRTLDATQKIYKHRNEYVHNLRLLGVTGRPTLLHRRSMEDLFFSFVDVHEQQQVLRHFDFIARETGLVRGFILEKIQSSYDRSELKKPLGEDYVW